VGHHLTMGGSSGIPDEAASWDICPLVIRLLEAGNTGRIQPNNITGFKFNRFVLGVVVFCLEILGMLDILHKPFVDFMKIESECFGS